ncbi:MAG: phage minor capsid protein [Galactobacter sp.]
MRWTPPPGEDLADVLDRLTGKLVGVYADAEERLLKAVAAEVGAGLNPDQLTPAELTRLRQAAEQIRDELAAASPDLIQGLVDAAAEKGMGSALTVLKAMPGLKDAPLRRIPYVQGVANVVADLTNALDDVRARILRLPDDVYRMIIADTTAETLLLGANPVGQQARAWRRYLDNGVTGFVDKAGRRWNLASYTEMASRTATVRAYRSQNEHTMRDNGINLVKVVGGNDMCDKCGAWTGRILSMDGTPAGSYPMLSAVSDAVVTVRVEGTLDEARAAGLFHPNCRDTTVAFLPGVEPINTGPAYDPQMEADRDHLRALERRVRKLKRDQILDGPDPSTSKKIADAQAQIRDHVETTGLKRQRRREQLNLGNRRR